MFSSMYRSCSSCKSLDDVETQIQDDYHLADRVSPGPSEPPEGFLRPYVSDAEPSSSGVTSPTPPTIEWLRSLSPNTLDPAPAWGVQELMCYIWDNCLQIYDGVDEIFLMGVGNAYLGVKVLLINRAPDQPQACGCGVTSVT
ncbi:hypothetical protein QBC39DRAFT_437986 [Podospora conica]|nr:hypothetical protein QBC39DRAFT_437986 [Schizothecium conicum]